AVLAGSPVFDDEDGLSYLEYLKVGQSVEAMCIMEIAQPWVDRLDVIQALIALFRAAQEAGESCPSVP
ncbi:MAG: hypothetical protein NTU41_15220, partial [Chloroflexi bacterium]|nr:hypothetical protein [Chloroflexota bacterium]